ncbi:hypothetical protein [Streptomyces sp. NPDC005548]|uniref:hypothetical protein n=1 Tax=Streptomyces sp. NPDC005548 TaxID=3364724 RepID=UPI00367D86A1
MNAQTRQQQNEAAFWNQKQAAATTPKAVAAVWYDACRKVAANAEKNGGTDLYSALASHLHDFFQRHTG